MHSNNRVMPWKFEKDPYKIWLSEIILQQTRVAQGTAYYNRFIKKYPAIEKLAKAKEAEVFKLWEGLGYYSRCRNLMATATLIHEKYKNVFPSTYKEILSLKGVGPYTAAAIASFGFDLPYAVVDGNVMRVLSRFFGIFTPIDTTLGKKTFNELAQLLLDPKQPAQYNQAIMDFGATVCKPQSPLCNQCPLSQNCLAFKKKSVDILPKKSKKIIVKQRFFNYFLLEVGSFILIKPRTHKDIWKGLHEFLLSETSSQVSTKDAMKKLSEEIGLSDKKTIEVSKLYKQKLTHQEITARFIRVQLDAIPSELSSFFVQKKQLKKIAFPKIITEYLEEAIFINT